MVISHLTATPHPDGNRIDLSWSHQDSVAFPGIRIDRSGSTFPLEPGASTEVVEVLLSSENIIDEGFDEQGNRRYRFTDINLPGTTTFYYSLFPYSGAPAVYALDQVEQVAATSTRSFGYSDKMYALLPAIFRRYDLAMVDHNPLELSIDDQDKGPLLRMLDIVGGQFDILHSFAQTLLERHNLDRVDARLLPLLAQWIGWQTDFRLNFEEQRSEIRRAPTLYKRIGLIPVVEATVKRLSGLESRSKEFVHNVLRTNYPPLLNLRIRQLDGNGESVSDGDGVPVDQLLSLDNAYQGRPTMTRDAAGIQWLFYHTRHGDRWQIWYKTSPTYSISSLLENDLVEGGTASSAMQAAFFDLGLQLSGTASIAQNGLYWELDDSDNNERYMLLPESGQITVYHVTADLLSMSPSQPLHNNVPVDEKNPVCALQGDTMWLFWSQYDQDNKRWTLHYQVHQDGIWQEPALYTLGAEPPGDLVAGPQRKTPACCVDRDGGLCLFWLQHVDNQWLLRHNRHDGTGLEINPTLGWELLIPASFPDEEDLASRVDDDLFVLSNDANVAQSLWLFWSRKVDTSDPAQTRWSVAYRIKGGLDPSDDADWGAVQAIIRNDEDVQDKEPAAEIVTGNSVRAYWSSNRNNSWSIWNGVLQPGAPSPWGTHEEITTSAFSQRDPVPVRDDSAMVLVYRSNERLNYSSEVYRATETFDFRYSGATTLDTRNQESIDLRGEFDDFLTYTYDTRREEDARYRRDTLGLYIDAEGMAPDTLERNINRVRNVMPDFLPATDRVVFITNEPGN